MNLTETQLKDIEELAGLFLSPEEIAILIDVNYDLFTVELLKKKGPVYKAYCKGKTESKKAIHTNVVKMATLGSPQAEEMANDFIFKQELAEKRAKK
nr:hypothetical protein [Bacteroidota bacterium]